MMETSNEEIKSASTNERVTPEELDLGCGSPNAEADVNASADANADADVNANANANANTNTNTEGIDAEKPESEPALNETEGTKTDNGGVDRKEDEALNVMYVRLAADFQNYKRRAEKEKRETYAYAIEKIALNLLDIRDNFERALEHSGASLESFYKGMEMIFRQLTEVLAKYEVEEIEISPGQPFDTALHQAVMMEERPAPENGDAAEVLLVSDVFTKGYKLKDKVIRHAAVKVVKDYV